MIVESFMEFIKSEVTLPEEYFEIAPAFYQSRSKEQFEAYALRPENWYEKSQLLKLGADTLFEKAQEAMMVVLHSIPEVTGLGRLHTPREEQAILEKDLGLLYFQLSGSSIENLLKGIIIAKDPNHLLKAEGQFSKEFTTHDLPKLLVLAGVSIPVKQKNCPWSEDLPKKLTRYIEWQGRYPVPRKVKENNSITSKRKFDFEGKFDLPWCTISDKNEIDYFYSFLWEQRSLLS